MRLHNTLSIPVPVREAWQVLLDIERIAPCVPGATLTSRDGDRFHGKVKVKIGPIGLAYSGTVTFVSLDEAAKVAVLEAAGRETRGGGTAKATVTCRLTDHGDATEVLVETDLAITGKPAQFGRGALTDVATTLIGRFAANLADEIADEVAPQPSPTPARPTAPDEAAPAVHEPAPAPGDGDDGGTPPTPPQTTFTPRTPAEPINLLQAAGGGVLGRVGPLAVASALLILLLTIRLTLRRLRSAAGSQGAEPGGTG
ncbi:Carbon monoxide dehydrogenase subunit G [Thermomonospora echinospora]|uniref:Carbon monoxide dehydrogenase subunit G n=1 Tax=Thermomonospora echinospora TaxID=1992 RepID=A0A1H6D8F9_9ACTN|nr:SRPBCC family protein [Thermomonospora echinospora]SEG81408.1 Carbon monoxide dehydrogenase subunit G [Thermomonospora echinospora]